MTVNVKELKNEGLVKDFEISCPAESIISELEAALLERQKTFKMAGFREGKVPLQMIRKQAGPELLAGIIEKKVDETLRNVFEERSIRPALQPVVEIKSFDDKKELTFTVKVECLPELPAVNWEGIELETYKVKITDEDLTRAHEDIVKNFKNFDDAADSYAAKKGDAVIIDFVGTINGEEFDGGKADGIRLELGSGQFIPGFEDQLIGAKKGLAIKVRVTFPKDYNNAKVAGKPAVFDVKVQKVLKPQDVGAIDDEFAKKLGLDSLETLNNMIKQKIESDFNGLARLRMKKVLFDKIDAENKFDIPPGMMQIDFDAMWREIEGQMKSNPEMFKGKSKDQLKEEYSEIAKRRVRLGILLAETAKNNSIEVSNADLQQAVYAEAMMRPGQEKIVLDFYSKPENMERLKGPILEEKAVDFIMTKVKKSEIEMTSKEFFDKYAEELKDGTNSN